MCKGFTHPENFIPKYFVLGDLMMKNHFNGFYPCQMTAIVKWTYPCTSAWKEYFMRSRTTSRHTVYKKETKASTSFKCILL